MRKWIAGAVLVLTVGMVSVALGQKAMESTFGSPLVQRVVFRAASADSNVFALPGESAMDSSGVFWSAATTGLTIKSTGDSPLYLVEFFAGHVSPLASNVAQADTDKYVFATAPFDTFTVTAAGIRNRQISLYMDIALHWYARLTALAGNGSGTLVEMWVTRQRGQ